MRISKRQQGAETSVPLQDQDREKIHSSGLRPTLSTAILPNCISERRKSLSGQSDVLSHGKLVFAVRNVTDSEESVSDELLLKSVAEGDKAAMHIMFARHRVRVFRFIQRMVRNTAIADDLVSQVFLDVWRSANSFESRSRVFTWLLSIARFKALSSLRQRTYENIDQDDVAGIVDSADTPEAALSKDRLSRTDQTLAFYKTLRDRLEPGKPIWLTETAEAACGGNPWAASFLDTFRYLDQLGRLARSGVQVVMHNTLAASDYGLLDQRTLTPRPNYWGAWLWRQLMGTTVLDAGMPIQSGLHVYAHCQRGTPGGVALLVINTDRDAPHALVLPTASLRYTLDAESLLEDRVRLNGSPLLLGAGDELPTIAGAATAASTVTFAQATITFLAIPDAGNNGCR